MAEETNGPDNPTGQHVLILAAGRGRRMGGPKVLATHGGVGFLERILARCAEAAARVTLLASQETQPALEALLGTLPPTLLAPMPRILHADSTAPMAETLRLGLQHGPYLPGCWVWPVDNPFLSAGGWQALRRQAGQAPDAVWKPVSEGVSGHPIWLPAHHHAALLAGPLPDGLRGYLRALSPGQVRALALEGEHLPNVNRSTDLPPLE